jgi:hypothetical protein
MQPVLGSTEMRHIIRKIVSILDGTPAEYGERRKGQSLIEMAFITPILVLMVMGMVEIGWFANNYLNLLESAKVGARRAPFLNAENGAIFWDSIEQRRTGSIAPRFYFEGSDDHTTSLLYRGGLDMETRCDSINANDFGFYNLIACTVLDSMDPLQIRPENGFDDIVISAFSLQRVNIGDPLADHDVQVPGYSNGHQVIVVGRWPSNANECMDITERDPFDWIIDNQVTSQVFTFGDGRPDVRLAFEMYRRFNEQDRVYEGYLDETLERQRGFAWTGQRQVEDANGNRLPNCFGSSFGIEEIQRRMNLPNFIEDTETGSNMRRSHLPSQGLVLVEIFWKHRMLLFNGRLSPVYMALTGGDPDSTGDVIRVWAAFPAPSVEPSILFKPPADD